MSRVTQLQLGSSKQTFQIAPCLPLSESQLTFCNTLFFPGESDRRGADGLDKHKEIYCESGRNKLRETDSLDKHKVPSPVVGRPSVGETERW